MVSFKSWGEKWHVFSRASARLENKQKSMSQHFLASNRGLADDDGNIHISASHLKIIQETTLSCGFWRRWTLFRLNGVNVGHLVAHIFGYVFFGEIVFLRLSTCSMRKNHQCGRNMYVTFNYFSQTSNVQVQAVHQPANYEEILPPNIRAGCTPGDIKSSAPIGIMHVSCSCILDFWVVLLLAF